MESLDKAGNPQSRRRYSVRRKTLVVAVLVVAAPTFLFFAPVFPYLCAGYPTTCIHGTVVVYESPLLMLTADCGHGTYGAMYVAHVIVVPGDTQPAGYGIVWWPRFVRLF